MMRLVFMGTPQIAEVALAALLREGHEVVGVYTRADKPQGRKQVVTPPPVKVRAVENRIPVFQPEHFGEIGVLQELEELAPELIVVVAYGLLLPREVLALPKHGCINLHVSLLPAYRGAAPIQWAVINGERETGVSVMQMDEGLDTGPVLASRSMEIPPEATAGEMFEMATGIGARLLAETVNAIAESRAAAVPQPVQGSSAPRLTKQMARLDFELPAQQLHNLARGCNPWPLAWFESSGKKVKVQRTRVSDYCGEVPGQVLSLKPLTVTCGEGALELLFLLPEGARAMPGEAFAAGRRLKIGDSIL